MNNPVTEAVTNEKVRLRKQINEAVHSCEQALIQYQCGLITASELFQRYAEAVVFGQDALLRLGDYAQQEK